VWDKREQTLEQFALMFDEVKEKTFRSSVGHFTELEDMLCIWIDSMCCANLLVPPSLAISTRLLPNMILKMFTIWTRLACFFTYYRDTAF
jgi:hypothetical protein